MLLRQTFFSIMPFCFNNFFPQRRKKGKIFHRKGTPTHTHNMCTCTHKKHSGTIKEKKINLEQDFPILQTNLRFSARTLKYLLINYSTFHFGKGTDKYSPLSFVFCFHFFNCCKLIKPLSPKLSITDSISAPLG